MKLTKEIINGNIKACQELLDRYKAGTYHPANCPLCIVNKVNCEQCAWTIFTDNRCGWTIAKYFNIDDTTDPAWISRRIAELPEWIERLKEMRDKL